MNSIFNINTAGLEIELKSLKNKDLLDYFIRRFTELENYQTRNPIEETQLLEVSKVYINEFQLRLQRYLKLNNIDAINEFTQIIQDKIKEYSKQDKFADVQTGTIDTTVRSAYMIRNLFRLYGICIRILKKSYASMNSIRNSFL